VSGDLESCLAEAVRGDEESARDLIKLAVLARQGTPWAAEIPDEVEIVLTPLPGPLGMTWIGTLDGRPFSCLTELSVTLPRDGHRPRRVPPAPTATRATARP
jgi:hypothetical protein